MSGILVNGQPTRNRCCTYFRITGDFDPDEVTALLGLQPDEAWKRGDPMHKGHASMRREGLTCTSSAWLFGRCDEYDPYVETQMRRTIAPLLDKVDLLSRIREENDVGFYLVIVPNIYAGDVNPCLAPPLDVIDFCHATRTEIDIDMYIYDSADE